MQRNYYEHIKQHRNMHNSAHTAIDPRQVNMNRQTQQHMNAHFDPYHIASSRDYHREQIQLPHTIPPQSAAYQNYQEHSAFYVHHHMLPPHHFQHPAPPPIHPMHQHYHISLNPLYRYPTYTDAQNNFYHAHAHMHNPFHQSFAPHLLHPNVFYDYRNDDFIYKNETRSSKNVDASESHNSEAAGATSEGNNGAIITEISDDENERNEKNSEKSNKKKKEYVDAISLNGDEWIDEPDVDGDKKNKQIVKNRNFFK